MADNLNSLAEVYPYSRWVPCTSNLVCHESSGSPEKDGIENLSKYFHPSKRRKHRSYRSVASVKDLIEDLVFGSEMSPYPPLPLPKSKKRIKEELAEERMSKLAEKIRNYHTNRCNIPNATENPYNTLFVARLSYESTAEALVNEFYLFGQILDVRLVTNREGRSRGYAFIEFVDQDSLKNALASSREMVIDGREVLLDTERGRLEIGWLPRRLGGGLGVKSKIPKKNQSERRQKKKEKAEAREPGVTSTSNTEASSENNRGPAVVDVSKQLETIPIVEKGSQTKIAAKKARKKRKSPSEVSVEPRESSTNGSADFSGAPATLPFDNPPQNRPVQRASCNLVPRADSVAGEEYVNYFPIYQEGNHPNQPVHLAVPAFNHQSSVALPQNYAEEIPAASCVQFEQPDQYSLPQPYQIRDVMLIHSQVQQLNSYNSSIVPGTFNAPPVNYIQPVAGFTSQPYSNFYYPSHAIPAHRFHPQSGHFEAQPQNYRVQLPHHPVLQPVNHNINYLVPNWQPISHMPYSPPQNYQASPMFYPHQQLVSQNSSQYYQNYNGLPRNRHIQLCPCGYPIWECENHYAQQYGN